MKKQKPIEIDAHFKYRCPKCAWDHWISLAEAQTKNFKIVCDCKSVFKPKRIKTISIQYAQKPKIEKQIDKNSICQETNKVDKNPIKKTIDQNVLNKSIKILIAYGFTKPESSDLILKAYDILQIDTPSQLVKKALELIGEQNELSSNKI